MSIGDSVDGQDYYRTDSVQNWDGGDPLNMDERCGRCGCKRREHIPSCQSHPKCARFSGIIAKKPKKAKMSVRR